ncbi:unnamed protein product (macronuclear) [Paramecium tetraurelia]|uniref:GYF domain-containing protein n=1 Tax=Paramecium tetraurelia TaxID=5888 RepID=A0CZI9_PARTE|nr:uncharacterized protein GSPATT00011779001 [Paramecium tetraurelia]CAK76206.1 unnamed protein product [Paramecium tetraurelia]|eukprot:XP_001443603.1 hypothetical protein (macronuclear) [Paramecium tetraurelia strain d4-2]
MDIYFNGQPIQVPENLTFYQLFQYSGLPGNISDKYWQRNGQILLVNQNSLVKDLVQPHNQLQLIDKPQKTIQTFNQQQGNFGNPSIISNQSTLQQKTIPQQIQSNPTPQFVIAQGVFQPQIQIKQVSQNPQSPYQSMQSSNVNLLPQMIYQTPQQNVNDDIFTTVQDPNPKVDDIFSTAYQYSNYETDRQNYLRNKGTSPGNKFLQQKSYGYMFTLDNYGDDLIIEKLDSSFYLKLNNQFSLNLIRQLNIPDKKQKFESNVILDLNCTRVSWIQDLEILAVQFNTGKIIAIQLYMG